MSDAADMLMQQAVEFGATTIGTGEDIVLLPGWGITITDTATKLFGRIAPSLTLFIRGGAVALISEASGELTLEIVSPPAARSLLEKYAKFYVRRIGRHGGLELKPAVIPQDIAAALLEAEPRLQLPKITGLLNCPVFLAKKNIVICKGFSTDTGLLITGGEMPPDVPPDEAVAGLRELVSEFAFQTPGDRSRALASFITPALRLGGHINGHVPSDVAEADASQSGKSFRQRVVAAVYNEKVALIARRDGGVGSVDESLAQRLANGRPFIQLDNFRGRFDSMYVEALLTAESEFGVRLPHCREIIVDPHRFFIMLSSNGVETTRDYGNRSSIVRICKQVGFTYKQYPNGDLLQHVRANQPYYLGCIFSIVKNWIANGCPRTAETRHDFREWCQVLDWIVQHVLHEAPLMDGHEAAQQRVSNPALTFLRKLALAVAAQGRLGELLNASQVYELCESAAETIAIPGLRQSNEDQGRKRIGIVLGPLFKNGSETRDGTQIEIDGFLVTREELDESRTGGGVYLAKKYRFERAPQ